MKDTYINNVSAAWSALTEFVVRLARAGRPTQLRATWLAFMPSILLAFTLILTGCDRREYRLALAPAEAIPIHQDVTLDGRVVGKVAAIREDGADHTRYAVLRITDQAARNAMRTGVEREAQGAVNLSSTNVKPSAAPLEPGSAIPTRTPTSDAAHKTLDSVQDVLWRVRDFASDHPLAALAAGIVAMLLLICLLRRCFARGVCAVLFLALFVAAASRPAKAAEGPDPGYSRAALFTELRQYNANLQRAKAEQDAARRDLQAGLPATAERSTLLVLLTLDATEVKMTGFEDRARALKASPIAYSREAQIKILLANANEMRTRLTQIRDDTAAFLVEQGPSRAEEWRGVQTYNRKRAEFMRRFQTRSLSPDVLADDIQNLQQVPVGLILSGILTAQTVGGWHKAGPNTWRSPGGQEFTQDGEALPKSGTPPLEATNRIEYVTNTITVTNLERAATDPLIARELNFLRQQGSNIEHGLAALRTNTPQVSAATPRQAPAQGTRLATQDSVFQPQPARPPPDTTTKKPEKVAKTNGTASASQAATRPPAANTASPMLTNAKSRSLPPNSGVAAAPPVHTNSAPARTAALEAPSNPPRTDAPNPRSASTHRGQSGETTRLSDSAFPLRRVQAIAAVLTVVGVFALLGLFFRMRSRADEPFVVKLLVHGREREFDVEAGRDAVFLDREVFCAEKNSPHPCPRVLITRQGAILHPPKAGPSAEGDIRLNGALVSNPCVLQPGDVITLAHANQPDQSIKFLGHAEAVPGVDEVEMQYAPANTTQ